MARRDIERSKLNVSDEKMARLREKARKANPRLDSFTDPEAVRHRLADQKQRKQAGWS
ncbi:hypothetical protein [Nonomuraea turkmeniaca]|uniref:hypothetical protein n=1 Tax=Nonomuraea turkmeniaca TaxID=103838 RepID=UPI001476AE25|nr:hypothetical protein [Nonomuraea turkmeniaca]